MKLHVFNNVEHKVVTLSKEKGVHIGYSELDDTIVELMAIRNAIKLGKTIDQLYVLKGYHPSCEGVVGIKEPIKHRNIWGIGLLVLADLADREHPHSTPYPVGNIISPIDTTILKKFPAATNKEESV